MLPFRAGIRGSRLEGKTVLIVEPVVQRRSIFLPLAHDRLHEDLRTGDAEFPRIQQDIVDKEAEMAVVLDRKQHHVR